MRSSSRIKSSLAALCLVAPAAFPAAAWEWPWASQSFDRDRWIAQRSVRPEDNARIGMVSMAEKQLSVGMPREAVLARLGEPDRQEPGRLVYDLGVSPYGIDYEWYNIELDPAGTVVRFWRERG